MLVHGRPSTRTTGQQAQDNSNNANGANTKPADDVNDKGASASEGETTVNEGETTDNEASANTSKTDNDGNNSNNIQKTAVANANFCKTLNTVASANSSKIENDGDNSNDTQKTADLNASYCETSCIFGIAVTCAIVGIVLCIVYTDSGSTPKIGSEQFTDSRKLFKNQDRDFWITIENSLKEIKMFDQPRTLLFVYEKEAGVTVDKIIDLISKMAICNLTDCSKEPIIISGPAFNTSYFLDDYGKVLVSYKDRLLENGVFVVKNIDKVPGTVAQAFHSFCDEYNPIVQRALFLFTIGFNKYNEENLVELIEKHLLKQWSELPEDKFYPLFTRISGMIMPVKQED